MAVALTLTVGLLASLLLAPTASAAATCASRTRTAPIAATSKTVSVAPYGPQGDADYDGHGPSVFVTATRKLAPADGGGNKIVLRITMRADETQADWTRGYVDKTVDYYVPPVGCIIDSTSLIHDNFDAAGFLVTGHGAIGWPAGDPTIYAADKVTVVYPGSFVSGFIIWGDQVGADTTGFTRVQVSVKQFDLRFTNFVG